jgi:hypothetical protein
MIDTSEATDDDWPTRRDRWLTHQKGQIMIDTLEGTDDDYMSIIIYPF